LEASHIGEGPVGEGTRVIEKREIRSKNRNTGRGGHSLPEEILVMFSIALFDYLA